MANLTEAMRLARQWADEAYRNGTGDNHSASHCIGGIVERWMLDEWRKEADGSAMMRKAT